MKVAINGTGVAGPALAYWLKHFGFTPVLFEQAKALRTGGYMIDFWGLGYDIAERMTGVLPKLREKAYYVKSLDIVDKNGATVGKVDTEFLRKDLLKNRMISLARSDVAATLFHACDGVESHFGVSIAQVEEQDDGVLVTLSNGKQEKFDLVIGADGLHSTVRSLAFGPETDCEHKLGVHVAAFTLSGHPHRTEDAYVSHIMHMKQAARVSLRDDKTLFLFTFRSELIEKEPRTLDEQKAAVKEAFKDMEWAEANECLSRLDESKDFYFDRVSQIRLDHWSNGRVALVGDAAACISLLGGEGTGLAIVEAFVLAGELHRAKGDYKQAFQNYHQLLQPLLAGKQKMAPSSLVLFAPRTSWDMFIARLIPKFSGISWLMRCIIGRLLRDDIVLPEYE